jgi:hypothetical protein
MVLTSENIHGAIKAGMLVIYTLLFLSVAYYTYKATFDNPTDPAKKL